MLTNGPPDTASFPTPRYLGKYAAGGHVPGRHARPVGERHAAEIRTASGAEAALALGVRADGAQEVHAAEVGPVGLAEVELRLGALPEQKAAEPLLPGGADHQVRVRLALGVEVLGDVLDVDDGGEVLERHPLGS